VQRREVFLHSPAIGAAGGVLAFGRYGRPVLAFPTSERDRFDYERGGMVDAIGWLLDEGRAKLYCVDGYDSESWYARHLPLDERGRRHGLYEDWVLGQVVPWIHADCGGALDIVVTGCSFGAYHAANLALKRADLFPRALCQSGVYDVTTIGGAGGHGDAVYFNNPVEYVANLHGDHLAWLRARVRLVLVVGHGRWEDATGALASTPRFASLLAEKGIPHELDVWDEDAWHDWPAWRAQLAKHLPRLC
jgi:esterase/lipase superfamily enzyme